MKFGIFVTLQSNVFNCFDDALDLTKQKKPYYSSALSSDDLQIHKT